MILESILENAGLTKQELADNLGVSIKTVYSWSVIPRYAIAYLELYASHTRLTKLRDALKEIIK